jgi:hypothetical protein
LKIDDQWDAWFIRRMMRKIEQPGVVRTGTFVTLLPGSRVSYIDGVFGWDLGRLTLDGDRLTYLGEQAKFSVARRDISGIEIQKGPLGWCRTHAVVVYSTSATFNVRLADRGSSRRLARRLQRQLREWRQQETLEESITAAEALPAPELPVLQPYVASRLRSVWVFGVRTVLMFLATILLLSVSPLLNSHPMFAFIPFTAPLVYLAVVCPAVFRSRA